MRAVQTLSKLAFHEKAKPFVFWGLTIEDAYPCKGFSMTNAQRLKGGWFVEPMMW